MSNEIEKDIDFSVEVVEETPKKNDNTEVQKGCWDPWSASDIEC